eukprot:g3307.t1
MDFISKIKSGAIRISVRCDNRKITPIDVKKWEKEKLFETEKVPLFAVNARIEALWKNETDPDLQGYFPGIVQHIDSSNNTTEILYSILYDDGYEDSVPEKNIRPFRNDNDTKIKKLKKKKIDTTKSKKLKRKRVDEKNALRRISGREKKLAKAVDNNKGEKVDDGRKKKDIKNVDDKSSSKKKGRKKFLKKKKKIDEFDSDEIEAEIFKEANLKLSSKDTEKDKTSPKEKRNSEYDALSIMVREELHSLYDQGLFRPSEMNERTLHALGEMSIVDAIDVLRQFAVSAKQKSISNCAGFLMGIIRRVTSNPGSKERKKHIRHPWSLFIGDVPKSWDHEKLEGYFAKYGNVLDCHVVRKRRRNCNRNSSNGLNAFVCFETPKEATKAIQKLNGVMLRDHSPHEGPLQVRLADEKSFHIYSNSIENKMNMLGHDRVASTTIGDPRRKRRRDQISNSSSSSAAKDHSSLSFDLCRIELCRLSYNKASIQMCCELVLGQEKNAEAVATELHNRVRNVTSFDDRFAIICLIFEVLTRLKNNVAHGVSMSRLQGQLENLTFPIFHDVKNAICNPNHERRFVELLDSYKQIMPGRMERFERMKKNARTSIPSIPPQRHLGNIHNVNAPKQHFQRGQHSEYQLPPPMPPTPQYFPPPQQQIHQVPPPPPVHHHLPARGPSPRNLPPPPNPSPRNLPPPPNRQIYHQQILPPPGMPSEAHLKAIFDSY